MCSTQIWLDRVEDMRTGESQSVGESVLAHVGFFLRLTWNVFHSVAELLTCSFAGSYGIISLWWSGGKACMVHSIWIAGPKLESYN